MLMRFRQQVKFRIFTNLLTNLHNFFNLKNLIRKCDNMLMRFRQHAKIPH